MINPNLSTSVAALRTHKLYLFRYHEQGKTFGRPVGYKARLLPRAPAKRVASRLRRAGLEIELCPIEVKLDTKQRAYLDRRYSHRNIAT